MTLGIYSIGLTMLGQRFQGEILPSANARFILLYCLGLLIGPAGEGVALDAWNPHGLVLAGTCLLYLGWLAVSAQDQRLKSISRTSA